MQYLIDLVALSREKNRRKERGGGYLSMDETRTRVILLDAIDAYM